MTIKSLFSRLEKYSPDSLISFYDEPNNAYLNLITIKDDDNSVEIVLE